MMDDNITIDPTTEREFAEIVRVAFNELVESLGDADWEEMEFQDIAEMFFSNGFFRGCIAMTDNDDLKETLHMMKCEIEYQTKK